MTNAILVVGIIFLIVVVVGILGSWILDRKSKNRRMESQNIRQNPQDSENTLDEAKRRGNEDYQRNINQVISAGKTFKGI
ncbi:hypothetical protein NEF87_003386 [Candidatus Lokiarchaeum ossiferum]|uniref:Uncharacterized protein n=1 Tax=Candidatus Lokiarchaeum ossiferum TaxID=2951803 RepID=A0ABY6HWZ1_9ARCH|nr:hypothetical protein NEF87_003386 [Candidatus Lokiarchaeum sp. B-35]